MSIEETVKALRTIVEHIKNGGDGLCFDICGECKNAADQLEQLQAEKHTLESRLKQLDSHFGKQLEQLQAVNNRFATIIDKYQGETVPKLNEEIERLKAEKPVRCGECINLIERHYEDKGEKPYIKYGCKYRGSYQVHTNDFCSYGERRDAE